MQTLERLNEAELLAHFATLVDRDRKNTVELIRCIIEIDQRKLWAKAACASLFAFVTERFHLSEAAAGKRIHVARVAQRFPVILEMLAAGDIHLSAVLMLVAHLTQENHHDVLLRASHKTKRQIEELVAELAPKPDVPSRVVALPQKNLALGGLRAPTQSAACPESPADAEAEQSIPLTLVSAPTSVLSPRPAVVMPLSPRRYKVEITVSEETRNKLAQLQDLLAHQATGRDPARVITRAIEELLERTLKKKAAILLPSNAARQRRSSKTAEVSGPPTEVSGPPTEKARSTNSTERKSVATPPNFEPRESESVVPRSRHIPASIRREVFLRDGGQCAFQDEAGHRCQARRGIEFHHVEGFAVGGAHTVDNLSLRCAAHNRYEAEQVYGLAFMQRKIWPDGVAEHSVPYGRKQEALWGAWPTTSVSYP